MNISFLETRLCVGPVLILVRAEEVAKAAGEHLNCEAVDDAGAGDSAPAHPGGAYCDEPT